MTTPQHRPLPPSAQAALDAEDLAELKAHMDALDAADATISDQLVEITKAEHRIRIARNAIRATRNRIEDLLAERATHRHTPAQLLALTPVETRGDFEELAGLLADDTTKGTT